jgi:hypothetical protein
MLKRAILLVGGPLAGLLLTVVTTLLLAGDLPDPIATHWNVHSEPDGHMPLWLFTALLVAVQLVAWGALLWQERSRGTQGLRLTVAPFVWGTIAFMAAIDLTTLAANVDAADWRAADEVGIVSILIVLAVGAVAAVAGWALERGRPLVAGVGAGAGGGAGSGASGTSAGSAAAAVTLAAGERAAWSRGLVSRPAAFGSVLLGVGFLVAGIVVGSAAGWALVAGGVVAALATALVSEVVVTVDRRGMTVAFGPLGWPRQHVPLDDVVAAEAVDVDPWRYGGWGYRKVPRRPGVSAVVLRRGEGLRVVRGDGRELVVTVPDAAGGAALLEALRQRDDG